MYLFFVYSDMKVYICRSKKIRKKIMKSRKPILYLAITFALVCLYQLSFTWKVNNIDKAHLLVIKIDVILTKKFQI